MHRYPWEWRPVEGYEGKYWVSVRGEVWSKPDLQREGFLRPQTNSRTGYLHVVLYKDGAQRTKLVQHLVADAFLGPKPRGMQVCHNDGVRTHNAAHNLRYDTPAGNQRDRHKHGTITRVRPRAKVTEEKAEVIRERYERGCTQSSIAEDYNITQSAVSRIVNKHTWK